MITDKKLRIEIEKLCKNATDTSLPLRKHRLKRIAHFDEQFHLNNDLIKIDSITFQDLEKSLDAIHSVLKVVSTKCFNITLENSFIDLRGSASELVAKLKKCAHKT